MARGEWLSCRWGDLATLEYGKGLRGYEEGAGPYRVYGTNGPIGWTARPLCTHAGVIIGRKGAYRGVHYSDNPFFVIDTAFYLEPKVDLDLRWAYYALLTHDINGMDSGSAIPSTSREAFYHLPVALPPPSEQRAIARILGTLDDKIELNRRMNETLEAMARALFQSWFVDFDPVRAKAEGHDPGSPRAIARLFSDRFEESEMGQIPAGWRVGTLGDYAALNPEGWSRHSFPETIEYVDLSNTKWGRIESTSLFGRHGAPSRAQRVLRSGDTIIGTVRPGNGSYARVADEGLTGSTGFAVLRPFTATREEFVYLASTASESIERLAHLADGGAYPAVRPEIVLAIGVVGAPGPVIDCFSRLAKPLLAKVAQNERESRTLAAIRDALLPRLLSGQIRVKEAEELSEVT